MKELFTNLPFVFGLVAACIHVLTGPDHLAAIGPLALNRRSRPWLLGIFWGSGHTLGMMIIGVLFFFFRDLIPVDKISAHSEEVVGIMLIVIGLWAFARLFKVFKGKHKHLHRHENEAGESYIHIHEHQHEHQHGMPFAIHPAHTHSKFHSQSLWAALGIGVIHGLAGISHLLALMPTLAFGTRLDAVFYLVGFAAGTLLAMSVFSMVIGLIGKYSSEQRKDTVYKTINILAGSVAVLVGAFWIWQSLQPIVGG
jgi:ABC-type nickel/cobalt efflux system permease component RcnA